MNILQKAIRGAKDVALRRSETEILVRDATSNEASGPNGSDMRQIADLTYSPTDYNEIMTTLWERLEDDGKNWRHVYKGLLVIDYLIKNGSERVAQECKFRSLAIKTLSEFQFIDEDEKDQGLSVRQRAKAIMELLNDEKRLNAERETAAKNRDRFGQSISSESGYQQSRVYARGSARNHGGGYAQGSHDRYSSPGGSTTSTYGSSTGGSRRPAQQEESSSDSEEAAPAPTKTRSSKRSAAAPAKSTAAAAPQPDLLGFDAFGGSNGAQNDFFDPRANAKPAAQPQSSQPQFFPSTGNATANRNHIDFFAPSTGAAPQQTAQFQAPQQFQAPPPQTLPGNPQRLPNGNLLVEGHEITVQQYQQYLEYLQRQTQQAQQGARPQQAPPQQQAFPTQQPMQQLPPQTQQRPAVAADDWNDFTGASKSPGFATLTPSTNGSASSAASQPAKPRDKFDDLLDISSLSMGGGAQPTTSHKSQEPTLAQLQAQKQAQAAQQSSFGYAQQNNGFGQPQFGQQPPQQNNGFFF